MPVPPKKTPNPFASTRCIVFDAVGTLIHPDPPASIAYYGHGRRHGSQLSQEDIATRFSLALQQFPYMARTDEQQERQRWRGIVAEVFTDLDTTDSLFQELWSYFADPQHWSAYDDVFASMKELRLLGLTLVVGSNFDERLLGIVEQSAPLNSLDAFFISSQLGYTKPSIEFFRSIERELRLASNQLLMVGDDESRDVEGAANAGWHRLWLNRVGTAARHTSIRSLREISSYFV